MTQVTAEELPTKELREMARRFKRGYTLERTSKSHYRVRDPEGKLVQWKGKNLMLNQNVQHTDASLEALTGAGVLQGTRKPARLTPEEQDHRRRGIDAMRETQRKAIKRRQEATRELRDRMRPWMKAIGAGIPGVTLDLARYLHKTTGDTFASVESAHAALKNITEGQGIKDESREAVSQLSERFEREPEPLMLYVELARELRGIEVAPSTGKEWPYSMRLVDVDACFADPEYQRPPTDTFVRSLVLKFDERKVGSIQVSARPDERYAILDGQTRHRAVHLIGKKRIWAAVYEGMTLADEARFFFEVNHDRKSVHPYYGFRARMLSGDPKVIAINKLVEQHGLRVSPNTDPQGGGIAAVSALEKAYDQPSEVREDTLSPTLEVLARWKGMSNSTNAELIRGFGRFYATYGDDEIQHEQFGELLGAFGPNVVLARARDEAEKAGRARHGAMAAGLMLARALVAIHNTGLPRGDRLNPAKLGFGAGGGGRR